MNDRRPPVLRIAVSLVLAAAAACGSGPGQEAPLAGAALGGPFTLVDQDGKMVREQEFAGRYRLVYFGYTYCPDVCPTSLLIWAQALKELTPQELTRVQPIFVSVDPERDTLPRLAEYAAFFHPSLLPLTGSPERLHEIAARYGAYFARQENAAAGGYVVDHTSSTLLIDRDGRLVARLAHATSPEQLLAEIRKHLPPN